MPKKSSHNVALLYFLTGNAVGACYDLGVGLGGYYSGTLARREPTPLPPLNLNPIKRMREFYKKRPRIMRSM